MSAMQQAAGDTFKVPEPMNSDCTRGEKAHTEEKTSM